MDALIAGLILGFGSGIAPGPLFALVVSTTLQRGLRAGVLVAAAPLVTDLLIIVLSLTVLTALPATAVAILGLIGALVLLGFGAESLLAARTARLSAGLSVEPEPAGFSPLRRGALVNLLNPSPWLFWVTVGGPLLVSAWRQAPQEAVLWLVGFYGMLVGSKMGLAVGLAAGRSRLTDRWYRRLLVLAGLLLIVLAGLLAAEAIDALRAES